MSDKEKAATEDVRFFSVSLVNATPMSLPKFPQPQRLMGELIHSIEAANPKFAWVQFLFKRVNLSPTLVALKNSVHMAAEQIKTPQEELDRRQRIGQAGALPGLVQALGGEDQED